MQTKLNQPKKILLAFIIFIIVSSMVLRGNNKEQWRDILTPSTQYHVNTTMEFNGHGGDVAIRTYEPVSDEYQQILFFQATSGSLDYNQKDGVSGREAIWKGTTSHERQSVSLTYEARIKARRYNIDPKIPLPAYAAGEYLQETEAIPVFHPEISILSESLQKNTQPSTEQTLRTIFNYILQEIETVPFKGLTDSLTALRLQQASCNGKSRLFVSLARLNKLPARLVGGLILESGKKRTSHQWVEVKIDDYWVPFDPTNGHFAELPGNYLALYYGDQALFRHSANINFQYIFDIKEYQTTYAEMQLSIKAMEEHQNTLSLLAKLGLDIRSAGLFLLFPLAALVISFFRNIIGLTTFGTFMPMLVAAALTYTGLWQGLLAFAFILIAALLTDALFDRISLLRVPRLAAVITAIILSMILLINLPQVDLGKSGGMLTVFQVVILAFTADRLHSLLEKDSLLEVASVILATVLVIVVCHMVFSSVILRSVVETYPEILLVILALQILIGRWHGVRVSEILRFRQLMNSGNDEIQSDRLNYFYNTVLGINERNLRLVNLLNKKKWIAVANDKIQSKLKLEQVQVSVPKTLMTLHSRLNLDGDKIYEAVKEQGFVIKPAHGSRGNGIWIGRESQGAFYNHKDERVDIQEVVQHCSAIINGDYSDGEPDNVMVEYRIQPAQRLLDLCGSGIADIRVILIKGQLAAAMLRLPTKKSKGKANLHQGAVGVAIDIRTGITTSAYFNNQFISKHPDTGAELIHVSIPQWSLILKTAINTQYAIPLGYIGVDICIDENLGPLVIEANARPGLQIQNVSAHGLKKPFLSLAKLGI